MCLFIGCCCCFLILSYFACHCLMLFQDDEGKFKGLWNGNSSFEIVFEVVAAADIDSDGINFWKGISGPEQLHKQTNLSPRAQLSAWLFLLLLIIKKSYLLEFLQTATTAASMPVFLCLFFYGCLFPLVLTKGTEGHSSEMDAVAQWRTTRKTRHFVGVFGFIFQTLSPTNVHKAMDCG